MLFSQVRPVFGAVNFCLRTNYFSDRNHFSKLQGCKARHVSSSSKATQGPLSGYRVLDLSRVLAGPWCSQLLSDLGADVIKVEHPHGDDTRGWGPPYLKDKFGRPTKEAAYFLSANRGKKSIAIDMSKVEGQKIIHDLAKKSHILLENFKVGSLAKFRLDYETIKTINPDIVYCSITGFGQTGPRKDEAGYDFMIQAMGGMMSLTGEPGRPQKVGMAVVDILTGMYATVGILAALLDKNSRGRHIDLALFDTQLAFLCYHAMNYLVSGNIPQSVGNQNPYIMPYCAFEAKDGLFVVAVGSETQWQHLCKAMNRDDLAANPKFATNNDRVVHRVELYDELTKTFKTQSKRYWIETLHQYNIPCAMINNVKEALEEPQAKARNTIFSLPHPLSGQVPMIANPIQTHGTEALVHYNLPPPLLGQHTDEVSLIFCFSLFRRELVK
jgi:crotonobetainyl-CoA:carnitine CoA-transferase CaiB-like acyl-CoA transferase